MLMKCTTYFITGHRVGSGQETFQSLQRQASSLLDRHLNVSRCCHALMIDIPESEPDLSFDFLLVGHLHVQPSLNLSCRPWDHE